MPLPESISPFFYPRSLAIIGSADQDDNMGDLVLGNLVNAGYTGKIFPVNLKAASILGLPCLRKPDEIPEEDRPLDLAVICLPLGDCPRALRACAALPVKAVLFMRSGFNTNRNHDFDIAKELLEIAEEAGIALLGPNSLGIVNTSAKLNLCPQGGLTQTGHIAFFSQSSGFGFAMFSWAKENNIAFSSFVSLGDRKFLDESDLLTFWADDPQTKVIAGYLENVADGPRFLDSAGNASRKKPVILFKPGNSPEGAIAASSHSGLLSGSDMAYSAAFRQSGIIRAQDMRELFAMSKAFSMQPLPKGPAVAVITNSGAPGIIAADACSGSGLNLARLSPATLAKLQAELPPGASIHNPIDVEVAASCRHISLAARAAMEDKAVHALAILACPAPGLDLCCLAEEIISLGKHGGKTVFACLMGGHDTAEARRLLSMASIPCFELPEEAIKTLGAMYRQSEWREHPLPVEIGYRHDKARAQKVVDDARARGISELSDFYSLQILAAYEVPCLEAKLARTSDEAVQLAKQLGVPVAIKIASPHIPHKSDVGGVALNIMGKDQVRAAFLDITTRAKRLHKEAYIAGCHVQAMARKGSREVIIGFKRDSVFGPMVYFGLGGIHMHTFRDVSCRLAPLSLENVHDMVREIRAFPVLAGSQGQSAVKFTALEDVLLIISQLAVDFPEIQEVECNPVFADEHGAQVGDMRILLALSRHLSANSD